MRPPGAEMSSDELRRRIATWRNFHTDFRPAIGSPEQLSEALVCLANSDGGQLVIGVAEDRTIPGVDPGSSPASTVSSAARDGCVPPLSVTHEIVTVGGRVVLVVNVPKGDRRPYCTRSGRCCVRTSYGCRQVSHAELVRLFHRPRSTFDDAAPLHALDLADLDMDAAERYIAAQSMDDDTDTLQTLRAWRLVHHGHPTVAGILLFGRNPQQALPAAGVVLVAYRGTDPGDDIVDRHEATGGLLSVIEQVETFHRVHLRSDRRIRGSEPEADDELPTRALREAAVNALVHRDYTISGPTLVMVFADRVEVHSPGRPPGTIDEEAMRAGVHLPRNPHVYSRVSAAGLSSGAGSGVPRIARLLREHNGSELGIKVSDTETVLVLPRPATDVEETLV